jgi:hypothetical protein
MSLRWIPLGLLCAPAAQAAPLVCDVRGFGGSARERM